MTNQEEVEKLGDLIYEALRTNELTRELRNRALITEVLAKAIIKAGWVKEVKEGE